MNQNLNSAQDTFQDGNLFNSNSSSCPTEKSLNPIEKYFLLHAERGDCSTIKRLIRQYKERPEELNINCVDPLNRSALVAAIENENPDLIKILLEAGIQVKDALLHSIKEEYVEAVELLLDWEDEHHNSNDGQQRIKNESSLFTPDITPLILAAHKNNFEIIKLLLDRGATLPIPHDVKCGCESCVKLSRIDSLSHSKARINAYRALTSPSLIALSSKDPILTAFQLSRELKRLSRLETEFSTEYNGMRKQIENFATSLLDYARTSFELEIILNYNPNGDNWVQGERHTLERLRLAIKCEQKSFAVHPNVQQLLASIWYEGVPGFKRKNLIRQGLEVIKLAVMSPLFSIVYMFAPTTKMGRFMTKPFIKFICHSASYGFFIVMVSMASQKVEISIMEWMDIDWFRNTVEEWKRKERGSFFNVAECGVILYVIGLVWNEVKNLWFDGIYEYASNLWNVIDFVINVFYITWIALRLVSWYIVKKEASQGKNPYYPREQWHTFDPMLLSEGAFAAGMIFSFLKLVHIFSISPHLGPLQISLGRMIIDIMKFFLIYTLVLFAFACGLNQLLWYYAELERNKCYLNDDVPDFESNERACTVWRSYANLFETSQSLFWASFGLVDLLSFELTGIKGFTRFWALLMFGSYSVINVIVLLNMLIAMMSNSYQIISEHSDVEWKFARSRLWINYFDECDTLPPPFNVFPKPKFLLRSLRCRRCPRVNDGDSFKKISQDEARERYEAVMRLLVKRYVTTEQQKRDVCGVTEDDVMEIRQDVSSLRYELINILKRNGMKTPQLSEEDCQVSSKKEKKMERQILKEFNIGTTALVSDIVNSATSGNAFNHIIRAIRRSRISKKANRTKRLENNSSPRDSTKLETLENITEYTFDSNYDLPVSGKVSPNKNQQELGCDHNQHLQMIPDGVINEDIGKSDCIPRVFEISDYKSKIVADDVEREWL